MRRGIKLYIFIIGVIFITFGPANSRADYDVIDITKPFLRKIPFFQRSGHRMDHS